MARPKYINPEAVSSTPTPYDGAWAIAEGIVPLGHVGSAFDRKRIASYHLYDAIYRNVSGTFKLTARGSEDNPIYIPSGMMVIEASNRFLGVDLDFAMSGLDEGQEADASRVLDQWLRKQRFWSKYATQKRYGLIRGDTMWHVVVTHPNHRDPLRRVRLLELDPSTAFAITSDDDIDEVVGWILIHKMLDKTTNGTTEIVKRIRYQYRDDGRIVADMNYFPADAWDDRIDPSTLDPYQDNVRPLPFKEARGPEPYEIVLPDSIDHLPVYHIRNKRAPLDPYGISELAGMERIIAAINQAITDEELALAMDGLGLYATTSGPPIDTDGNPTNWVLGPGRVVEIAPESKFERVKGVDSVDPSQAHVNWLDKKLRQASGTADTAVGQVDVQVAQSGIALALQMAPLLSKNKEKEMEMADEYATLFTDVMTKWMPEFDVFFPVTPYLDVIPVFADPMPTDRVSVVAEVASLLDSKIITVAEAQRILHDRLPDLTFDLSDVNALAADAERAALAADPFGMRMMSELV